MEAVAGSPPFSVRTTFLPVESMDPIMPLAAVLFSFLHLAWPNFSTVTGTTPVAFWGHVFRERRGSAQMPGDADDEPPLARFAAHET